MTNTNDKLNLRPQERRIVVIVGIIVFLFLNMQFIWPMFDDWKEIRNETSTIETKLNRYEKEIAQIPKYKQQLIQLESIGTDVASQTQALELQRIVRAQAAASGVNVTRWDPGRNRGTRPGQASQFFDEHSLTVTFSETGHQELVRLLINLATASSIIRVTDLNIKPNQPQTRLQGEITFIASYKKRDTTDTKPDSTPQRRSS